MYKRMLVPLDGSALAEVILPYTRELARRIGLDVVLIHIADKKDSETLLLHKAYVDRTADTIRSDLAKNQKKKSGVPRESQGIKVFGEVIVGYPAEEILRYADENDIDLILMATHGRSGIRRWVIGSVADKVLRSSRVPVLLVRTGIPQHIVDNEWPDTMLVPLDGSGLAELVLPHVAALAKQPNAKTVEVTLLIACEPPSMPAFAPPEFLANWGDMAVKQMAKSRNSAKKYLTRIEKQLNSAGLTVSSEVLEGQSAEEIVNYAAKNGSSLIVMATHGRSGLSRWAYGSVAEKVLLAASSPILLVRPASTGDPLPR
jgi:nucleotide-binding universal stress UspA family protein